MAAFIAIWTYVHGSVPGPGVKCVSIGRAVHAFMGNREHGTRVKSTILHFRMHFVTSYFVVQEVHDGAATKPNTSFHGLRTLSGKLFMEGKRRAREYRVCSDELTSVFFRKARDWVERRDRWSRAVDADVECLP